jgi:hypothetical protein
MTGVFQEQRDAAIARRLVRLPFAAEPSLEDRAIALGRYDATRPGARMRRYLARHPRLLRFVGLVFGFGVENPLADARLETIRSRAFDAALA